MHSHSHEAIEAKGLRRARAISAIKGLFFGSISIVSRNPGLALVSGHDIGDALALGDEVKASETHDIASRKKLMKKAGNKILSFTLGLGALEVATELLVPGHSHPALALGASATTLGLDYIARHGVKHDQHHAHHGIGHAHVDMDVLSSSVNLIGTASALALESSIPVYATSGYIAYLALKTRHTINMQADAMEHTRDTCDHEHQETEPHHDQQ